MEKPMTTAVLMIQPLQQYFDSTGKPLAGGSVTTYAAGTTTPLVTYTDATAATPAANPIVLDSAGRCQIWGVGSYKFVVKDSAGNQIGNPIDNVAAYTVPGNSGTPLFDTFSGDGSTTVFTLSQYGGTVAKELLVWIDAGDGKGFNLQSPTAYSVSGTALTFNSAPTSGSSNIYVVAPNILANAAAASASAAAGSATAASASATLASQWASQTSGQVASTDYSAKAYAIGGTGVTTTSGKGAAKEWATTTGGAVDTVEYSAKEYAVGTTATAGSAKSWATQTSGLVQSVDGSSKAWAVGGTGITTTASAGAAKEWATTTGGKVDTAEYSAKEYAVGTTAGTGSAKDWAVKTSAQVQSVDSSSKAWAIGGTGLTDGAAKNWAQQTGADVTGAALNSRSAKSWAQDDLHGATYGGSAKDWAQSASLPDGTNKSAKSYASDASAFATAAASSATTASGAAAAAAAAATSLANEWLFASSTTMADPGTGNFRLDNATFASVTNIALSALSGDSGNPNLHSFIMTWDDSNNSPRGIIRIEKNATNFIMLGVGGNITDNTTWVEIPVTVIASAGSFTAADVTFINFTQYGNNGTLTASGTPSAGQLAMWTSATALKGVTTSGDVTFDSSGVGAIGAGKVTNAMLAGSIDLTAKVTGILPAANGGTGNGFTAFSGPTTSTKTKTVRDASDTILELGGSYTPTGTWTSMTLVTPALGTPASGNLSNCTSIPAAALSGAITNGVTATTQTIGSNDTKVATDAYVDQEAGFVKNTITVTSNAGSTSVAYRHNDFTNSSASAMTITLTTTGAKDGQPLVLRIYDASAVAQTISWVNTENSTVSAPTTSNGSTTLPLTVGFQYNGATSKWRCVASA